MSISVRLVPEAVEDLARYRGSDFFDQLLAKLVRLEDVGKAAGTAVDQPGGWWRITLPDRTWRILFTMSEQDTVATVWLIGNRSDAAMYDQAKAMLAQKDGPPQLKVLTEVVARLLEPLGPSRYR